MRLYDVVESFVRSLGNIEIVARERYVLFRSIRIFTDLVVMSDALRVAVHLPRKVDDALFFKIARDDTKVTHVAKLRGLEEIESIKPYIAEAYAWSMGAAHGEP